jgi:S1-C subfamily serine protease
MKFKTALLMFAMVTLACCTEIRVVEEQGWEKVASKVLDSTVFFEAINEVFDPEIGKVREIIYTGSGSIISSDGWIITCFHVLMKDGGLIKKINVITRDKRIFTPEQVFLHPSIDLAIIKIKAEDLPFIKIRSTTIQIGEPCLSSGSPYPLQFVVNEGIVSQLSFLPYVPGPEYVNQSIVSFIGYFVHTASITQGNSGGPVVDKNGNLLGVNAGKIEDGPISKAHNFTFSVHIDDVTTKLDETSLLVGHKIYTPSN